MIFKKIAYASILILSFLIFLPCSQAQQAQPSASEEWMGVYLNGKKAGYASTTIAETPGGYEVKEQLHAVLSVLGFQQQIMMTTTSHLSGSLGLLDFRFLMDAGIARTAVSGKMQDNRMALEIDSGGAVQKQTVDFAEPPYVSSSVGLYLARQDLKAGGRFSLPYFDPATLSSERLEIEVEGIEEMKLGEKVVPVYRVREEYAGVSTRAWFSREAGTIKGDGPMGFTFVRETKEQAMRPPDGGYDAGDIIAMSSIPAGVNILEPKNVRYLKAKLSGGDFGGLHINGGRQSFSGGMVEVTREKMDNGPAAAIPVKDPALAEYLKAEPYIQSGDTEIMRKAADIVGGEKDALAAAKKLADWVHTAVKKKPSAGIPSAAEVLKGLSGDCNEHTVLYIALARAAGIPAKINAGVAMVGGRFYYHAWPEVWAGKWTAIDPTFGQFPADATHIRLEEGGLDRQVRIMKLMGKMKIEVLEYKAE